MVLWPYLVANHGDQAGDAVGLGEATAEAMAAAGAEADEAGEAEAGAVRHLRQFNYQSRKPAGVLHEVTARMVLRASTRMIHTLNLGILAASPQTLNKPAGKPIAPATSAEPKVTTPTKASVPKLRPATTFRRSS